MGCLVPGNALLWGTTLFQQRARVSMPAPPPTHEEVQRHAAPLGVHPSGPERMESANNPCTHLQGDPPEVRSPAHGKPGFKQAPPSHAQVGAEMNGAGDWWFHVHGLQRGRAQLGAEM